MILSISFGSSLGSLTPAPVRLTRGLHWSFEDPAQATGGEEERLCVFRSVRKEIVERIKREFLAEDS